MPYASYAWYVSKRNQDFTGVKLVRGQLVKPTGARNDSRIFGDNTHWTYRYEGKAKDAFLCGTDGCCELFADEAALTEHRRLIHAPERDARVQAQVTEKYEAARREENGETIGGHPIDKIKIGPGGEVPYIDLKSAMGA